MVPSMCHYLQLSYWSMQLLPHTQVKMYFNFSCSQQYQTSYKYPTLVLQQLLWMLKSVFVLLKLYQWLHSMCYKQTYIVYYCSSFIFFDSFFSLLFPHCCCCSSSSRTRASSFLIHSMHTLSMTFQDCCSSSFDIWRFSFEIKRIH